MKAIVTVNSEFDEVEVYFADRYVIGENSELTLQIDREKEYTDREGVLKKYSTYIDIVTYAPGSWVKVELVE